MDKYIPVYQPDFGHQERSAICRAAHTCEFLTANRLCTLFENEVGKLVGRRYNVFTNTGSSAVLVAVASQHWTRGDKIITPAVTFGTTLSPLYIYGFVPVFIDVIPGTYNVDPDKVFDALDKHPDIAGAVIPHTLGNPVYPGIWSRFERSVEDACDALGSSIGGEKCGAFGVVSTLSFFPAHHMTTIEGGMAMTNYPIVGRDLFRFANWGRDCYCRAGENSVCRKRFEFDLDGIPYDHKYIFSYPGFNVRGDELRASVGLEQLKKLKGYEENRRRNFAILDKGLRPLDDLIIPPTSLPAADPCWFSYPITLKGGNREAITEELEASGVATRLIFMGNAVRHPMSKGREYVAPHGLEHSDEVMRNAFSVGMNHTIDEETAYFVLREVSNCLKKHAKRA